MKKDHQALKELIIAILKTRQTSLTQEHLEVIIGLVTLNNNKVGYHTFDIRDALSQLYNNDTLVMNENSEIEIK